MPESHTLGGEDPVDHPRAHIVVDAWLEGLRAPYGLEILSVPQERLMRQIFIGGKEVMPKDK